MKKVYVYFTDGFEEIEAITPVDVLRRGGCEVTMVSVTKNKLVKSSHEVTITTDKLFDEVNYNDVDMIVLPGGPGATKLNSHSGLKEKILEMNQKGKQIAAICAAPMVLGQLGLLKGKKVTCFPGYESYLIESNCTGNSVELDGNIITGKGPGVSVKFALTLLEALVGKQKADEVKKAMMVE